MTRIHSLTTNAVTFPTRGDTNPRGFDCPRASALSLEPQSGSSLAEPQRSLRIIPPLSLRKPL